MANKKLPILGSTLQVWDIRRARYIALAGNIQAKDCVENFDCILNLLQDRLEVIENGYQYMRQHSHWRYELLRQFRSAGAFWRNALGSTGKQIDGQQVQFPIYIALSKMLSVAYCIS